MQLLVVWRTVFVAQFMYANGRGPYERGNVARYTLVFEELQILAQCRPGDVVLDVPLPSQGFGSHRFIQRSHRPTFAHHLQRDALPDVTLGMTVFNERFGRPAKHVDEARRDREPGSVYCAVRDTEVGTNGNDSVTSYGNVRDKRVATMTVVDLTIGNHQVETFDAGFFCPCLPGSRRSGEQNQD